jgi:hypothetical protein
MNGREINKLQRKCLENVNPPDAYRLLEVIRTKNTEIAKLKNKIKKLEEAAEWEQNRQYYQTPRPR